MRILEREHFGLPRVVQMFAEGEFRISGRRTEYVKKRS
jgi:folate-dependent phosphoribosylglycinamide formyltransferase PurN